MSFSRAQHPADAHHTSPRLRRAGVLVTDEIEAAAVATLNSYGRRFGEVGAPPVPVEEILECDLGLDFGLEDLKGDFGDDALGALWAGDRRVRVDTSLDPTLFPEKEGRYRFTVGHEIGHWQLHRHLFLAEVDQGSLFDASSEPSVVCRIGFGKPPIEWQADAFSARLLMPAKMLTRVWAEAKGGLGPASRTARRHDPSRTRIESMARVFKVSAQAMRIRLIELGLIVDHEGARLFR